MRAVLGTPCTYTTGVPVARRLQPATAPAAGLARVLCGLARSRGGMLASGPLIYARAMDQVVQIVGAVLILIAFAGVQFGRVDPASRLYLWLNLVGSLVLTAPGLARPPVRLPAAGGRVGAGVRLGPAPGGPRPPARRRALMPSAAAWKRPPPKRLRTILERLAGIYGHTHGEPHHAPVDELVLTVLSQNTNDRNRDVAYERLRQRFESWAEVRHAPEEEVVEAIRPGGLAPSKAPRIRAILDALDDDDLGRMEHEPLEQARAELCALPGVGARRRRACCCSPSAATTCRSTRTCTASARGWACSGPGAPLEECHDELLRLSARRGPVRVAHGADPPRPPAVLGALAALRRVPAAADVPVRAGRRRL